MRRRHNKTLNFLYQKYVKVVMFVESVTERCETKKNVLITLAEKKHQVCVTPTIIVSCC